MSGKEKKPYGIRFSRRFFGGLSDFIKAQVIVGLLCGVSTICYQYRYGLLTPAGFLANIYAVILPYVVIFSLFVFFHLVKTAWLLDKELRQEIEMAAQESGKPVIYVRPSYEKVSQFPPPKEKVPHLAIFAISAFGTLMLFAICGLVWEMSDLRKQSQPAAIPPSEKQSPEDIKAYLDIQTACEPWNYWSNPDALIKLRIIESNSTNQAVKSYAENHIKALIAKVETNAAEEMVLIRASGKFDNDLQAVAHYFKTHLAGGPVMLPIKADFKPEQTNDIIAYCFESAKLYANHETAPPYIWFLLLRKETGVSFEMYDFDAVGKWVKNHPVK